MNQLLQRIALLSMPVLLGACVQAKQTPAPQPPEVTVVAVHKQAVPVTTELPGRTSPYLVAQVRARVDGIVLKRAFTEGGDVSARQALYQIDPAPYRALLDNAKAAEQKAQANLASTTALAERYKILLAGNGVSVWLDCPLATVHARLINQSHRPLARDREKLEALYAARREAYQLADARVEIESDDPQITVDAILRQPALQ